MTDKIKQAEELTRGIKTRNILVKKFRALIHWENKKDYNKIQELNRKVE